jgi:hypothetical protein
MQKIPGLRKWAVDLLNYYSAVKLDDKTAKILISSEPIPTMLGQIPVIVHVLKDGREIPGCSVRYAPWAFKDNPSRYSYFNRSGSPVTGVLVPGIYSFSAHTDAGDGLPVLVEVRGDDPVEVNIPAP